MPDFLDSYSILKDLVKFVTCRIYYNSGRKWDIDIKLGSHFKTRNSMLWKHDFLFNVLDSTRFGTLWRPNSCITRYKNLNSLFKSHAWLRYQKQNSKTINRAHVRLFWGHMSKYSCIGKVVKLRVLKSIFEKINIPVHCMFLA